MSKFQHFWIILIALASLMPSKVNAQMMFDLIAPVQEDIINHRESGERRECISSSVSSAFSVVPFLKGFLQIR
jgi:hypothetical protein